MRDYLNLYGPPNDSRPLTNEHDEATGRPIAVTVEVAVEATEKPVQADQPVPATPVAEAPVEAAPEAPEGSVEASNSEGTPEHVEEAKSE